MAHCVSKEKGVEEGLASRKELTHVGQALKILFFLGGFSAGIRRKTKAPGDQLNRMDNLYAVLAQIAEDLQAAAGTSARHKIGPCLFDVSDFLGADAFRNFRMV